MKNFTQKFIGLFVFLTSLSIYAQCDLPQPFTGNTGSNMTVFFTSSAIDALPLDSEAPYIVAISENGLIVGSNSFASADLVGGQQSLAIWGDDTSTPETDGALASEVITFQLVDGNLLYDLNLTFAGVNQYTSNGSLPVLGGSAVLNCDESGSSSSCDEYLLTIADLEALLEASEAQNQVLSDELEACLQTPQCEEITINIEEGWNIFGYTSAQIVDIGSVMAPHDDKIIIMKNNIGDQYWPVNNYNGIGDFTPGAGYQIKASESFSISFEN